MVWLWPMRIFSNEKRGGGKNSKAEDADRKILSGQFHTRKNTDEDHHIMGGDDAFLFVFL